LEDWGWERVFVEWEVRELGCGGEGFWTDREEDAEPEREAARNTGRHTAASSRATALVIGGSQSAAEIPPRSPVIGHFLSIHYLPSLDTVRFLQNADDVL
jgi:hypothetical protein